MATIEERLTLIEHEHTKLKNDNTELKKTIELQTIAIGALVNKAALERLNEKYDKMFDALIAHDRFTNEQLAEFRGQQIALDGKITGLQTEMRQHFEQQDMAINARFDAQDRRFDVQDRRFDAQDRRFDAQDRKLDQILLLLNTPTPKPDQEA